MKNVETQWRNWAGTAAASPRRTARPLGERDVARILTRTADAGGTVRAVGSGHSFTDCAATTGTLLDVGALDRIEWVGPARADGSRPVRVGAGITLHAFCRELAARGLALANMGDIDRQTLAEAISTGTHGTGARLTGFAGMVEHIRIVTADGRVHDVSRDEERPCSRPPA